MQFTFTEQQNLEDAAAAAGVSDERIVAALAPLLYAAGLGTYPVDYTVTITEDDGHTAIDVVRGPGDPYTVDVLTGGAISAETAAVQGITSEDVIGGAVTVAPASPTFTRTQTVAPDSAGTVTVSPGGAA